MTASACGHPSSSGSSRFSSTTSSSAHARRSPAAASSVFSLLKAARSQLREPTGFLLGQQVWACADGDSDVGHPPILRWSSCAKARREKGQDWACGAWPFFFSRVRPSARATSGPGHSLSKSLITTVARVRRGRLRLQHPPLRNHAPPGRHQDHVALVWSVLLGVIIAVIGLVAFGGFAKGKWY
jgi:hypothetical protein